MSNFPNISRFITETPFSEKHIFYFKLSAVSFFSGFLLLGIVIQSISLLQNLNSVKAITSEREKVSKEIAYWKNVSTQYSDYRDVYFRIAALEYKMGNTQQSTEYMEKALLLDPNFEAGKVLGEKIKQN